VVKLQLRIIIKNAAEINDYQGFCSPAHGIGKTSAGNSAAFLSSNHLPYTNKYHILRVL